LWSIYREEEGRNSERGGSNEPKKRLWAFERNKNSLRGYLRRKEIKEGRMLRGGGGGGVYKQLLR